MLGSFKIAKKKGHDGAPPKERGANVRKHEQEQRKRVICRIWTVPWAAREMRGGLPT